MAVRTVALWPLRGPGGMLLLGLLLNPGSVVQEHQPRALQHNKSSKQHQSSFLTSWDEAEASSLMTCDPGSEAMSRSATGASSAVADAPGNRLVCWRRKLLLYGRGGLGRRVAGLGFLARCVQDHPELTLTPQVHSEEKNQVWRLVSIC